MDKIILQPVVFDNGDEQRQSLLVIGETEDKIVWSARDLAMDCPEDAILSRSLTSVHDIIELMELCSGKEVEILPIINCEEEEYFEKYS